MDKFFVILYLSICNVVWFYNFTLGNFKLVVFLLMIAFNYKIFLRTHNYPLSKLFFFLICSVALNLLIRTPVVETNKFYYLFGFIENYVLFVLGYNYLDKKYINESFYKKILWIIVPLCVIIVINFATGFPDWFSPSEVQRINKQLDEGYELGTLSPLYSTGFGIARTGWANSLCQFVPLILLLPSSKFKKISLFLIPFSIIISSSRGGLFCLFMILSIYYFFILKGGALKWFFGAIALYIICFIFFFWEDLYIYWEDFSDFLRLSNREDMTTGRGEQYLLLLNVLGLFDFWGLGVNALSVLFENMGSRYTLHNTYLRLLFELGVPFFICFITLLYYVFKSIPLFQKFSNSTSTNYKILSLILISGLISGLFEPQAVFGSVNWYCIWWFSFGVLYYRSERNDICTSGILKN